MGPGDQRSVQANGKLRKAASVVFVSAPMERCCYQRAVASNYGTWRPKKCTGAALMVKWLKAVFTLHASYLSTLPNLVPQLGALYQLMESRVKTLQKLSRLHGKLFLLVAQVAASDKAQDVNPVNQTAKLVYEEESSEEENSEDDMMADQESDENWEEDEEEERAGDPKMHIDKEISEDSGEDMHTGNESEEE
ncbi:uncharacterized protein LOC144493400 [Mustelus asterias]